MSDLADKRQERLKRTLYKSRECGSCRACCTSMAVKDTPLPGMIGLDKDEGVPCPHLAAEGVAKACTTYETRPRACREWACVWRSGWSIVPSDARPDRLGVMFEMFAQSAEDVHALLAYETRPGGFDDARGVMTTLAQRFVVVTMTDPHVVTGPHDAVLAFNRLAVPPRAVQEGL